MTLFRGLLLTIVLAAIAAAGGAYVGGRYVLRQAHREEPLHQLLHKKLGLNAEQQLRIEGLEKAHAARRAALEAEMRAANAQLAEAISTSHAYSPDVQHAIDRFHHAMGELQKESILHVLAMRQVLTPEQAKIFDETVSKALLEDAS